MNLNLTNYHLPALIDDEDFIKVKDINWSVSKSKDEKIWGVQGYCTKSKSMVKLGRLILNTPNELQIDHKNKNPLDNRKCNLRNVTASENCRYRTVYGNSKYNGVSWHKRNKKWQGTLSFSRNFKINAGQFLSEIEAALAVDDLRLIHHPDMSRLNFPLVIY